MRPLLARLLVPGLYGAEMEDAGQPVKLPDAEAALVEKSVRKRQREFALGRACARAALERLGYGDVVIGRQSNGAPTWPAGVTGSITHTKDYAAALAGAMPQFRGIGLDAERVGGVTPDLWPRLFGARECERLMALDAAGQSIMATLFFSAKEACYKAWSGAGPLAFQDIEIEPQQGGFTARRGGETLEGRHVLEDGLMVTATWF